MSFNDVLSDALARIRNAYMLGNPSVDIKYSNFVRSCMELICEEGYISEVAVKNKEDNAKKKMLSIALKYHGGKSVISFIERISKPSKRIYSAVRDLPLSLNGLGCYIVSTNKGIMTDHNARLSNCGGEVLFKIY